MSPDFEAVNGSFGEVAEDASRLHAPLSRRSFLSRGLAVVGLGTVIPAAFVRAVFAQDTPPGVAAKRRVLVVLQLGGGNDGLNTVIPYADGAYFGARPRLAVNPESVLPLDGRVGLHPSMEAMKGLWDQSMVAVVQGVGYPQPNRSHFRSMEIWHTGSLAEHERTGWLGRLLDATANEQRTAWHAANVGAALPMSFLASGSFVPSLTSVPTFTLATDPGARAQQARRTTDWVRLYAEQAALGGALALVSTTGARAYESTVQLQHEASGYQPLAAYPTNALGTALKTLSQVVTSNLGTTIGYVTTGGFDSHANQQGSQPGLLRAVSESVAAFYSDLAARGMERDVLTLVWTEFGRRVRENASGGTDHGTATPVFLVGGGVKPGLHGEPPSVGGLDDNGDLRFTTDFRSIYATLLAKWFATDPTDVLQGAFPELPFL